MSAEDDRHMLGVGLDSDGHKRVTTGENFTLVGGTQETHERMTETVMKVNEKCKERGKPLSQMTREEARDVIAESTPE